MGIRVTISDSLAELLEERRKSAGYPTLDAAAEALISRVLLGDTEDNHSTGHSADEIRDLLVAAEESGPPVPWSAGDVRAEILRRYAARK
jgi:hypothetical protein